MIAPKKVKLARNRRSILVGVTSAKPGRLSLGLLKGKRSRARASALLKGGSRVQRLRLTKGLRPGKHVLKVSFTPKGAKWSLTGKLTIVFVKAGKAGAARAAPAAPSRARIDASSLPAPRLPDGRAHWNTGDRRLELR